MIHDTITEAPQDKRKRARKPVSKKLSKTIIVCVTEREYNAYRRKADSKGLSTSSYVRLLIAKRSKAISDNTIDDSGQK
jgi:hypothetical protein